MIKQHHEGIIFRRSILWMFTNENLSTSWSWDVISWTSATVSLMIQYTWRRHRNFSTRKSTVTAWSFFIIDLRAPRSRLLCRPHAIKFARRRHRCVSTRRWRRSITRARRLSHRRSCDKKSRLLLQQPHNANTTFGPSACNLTKEIRSGWRGR